LSMASEDQNTGQTTAQMRHLVTVLPECFRCELYGLFVHLYALLKFLLRLVRNSDIPIQSIYIGALLRTVGFQNLDSFFEAVDGLLIFAHREK